MKRNAIFFTLMIFQLLLSGYTIGEQENSSPSLTPVESILTEPVEALIQTPMPGITESREIKASVPTLRETGLQTMELLCEISETGDKIFPGDTVSPEMFGAVGDGIADDTVAWKKAIESGADIKAGSGKTYKVNTLEITRDTYIDCNDANFVCTGTTLFSCIGNAETETDEKDYTAYDAGYTLSDEYTGIVYLYGTNTIFSKKAYYVGGSIERFSKGRLASSIPVEITDVKARRIHPIKVDICNIRNVKFDNSIPGLFTSSNVKPVIISQEYCAYSEIKNVNMTNLCYCVIRLDKCYNISYSDSHFDIPEYPYIPEGASRTKRLWLNNYPINILNSSYTKVENVDGHNHDWHCITTGGRTLCRKTEVHNCRFISNSEYAYLDHINGIETNISNCVISGIAVSGLSRVSETAVLPIANGKQNPCKIIIFPVDVESISTATIENCIFYPMQKTYQNKQVTNGIFAYVSNSDLVNSYSYVLRQLKVINCENVQEEDIPVRIGAIVQSNLDLTIKSITVISSNFDILYENKNTKIDKIYTWPEQDATP